MLKQPLGPLMVDVEGLQLTAKDIHLLKQPAVGAVILFARNFANIEQVAKLIAHIKQIRNPELLVAVDQEGGRVQRFNHGFYRLPPSAVFGQLYDNDPEEARTLAHAAGGLMAAELIRIGIDFSFAPVLDHGDIHSDVIGNRSFHSDTQAVCTLAESYILGMNSAGMSATGKHFPGHGGVSADSHLETPQDNRDLETLWQKDLQPFRYLHHLLNGIMTAHIHFPAVCSDLPTFSKHWLQGVLRQRIGFNGIIFSDDLIMKGAETGGNIIQRTTQCLDAGCNMALICNDQDQAFIAAEKISTTIAIDPALIESMRAKPTHANVPEAINQSKRLLDTCALIA